MASRTIVTFVDDMDGGTADETVQFALDGVTYEIDLASTNAASLRAQLASWVGAARRSGGRTAPVLKRIHQPARVDPAQSAKVREWAKANGYKVNPRGRISAQVMDAFQDAHRR